MKSIFQSRDIRTSVIKPYNDGNSVKANFKHHFHILDSIAYANINDTIYVGSTPSIAFMEINTRIESHSDGTLIGKITFSEEDLRQWHDWFDRNTIRAGYH